MRHDPRTWPGLKDPRLAPRHPVVVFAGGFGSGKSELALNYSLGIAAGGTPVHLVDLDIVKPFFRSREAAATLETLGVTLVAPPGELFHSDLPIVLPQVRALLSASQGVVVLDVGGDALGARVLASLAGAFVAGRHELLLVANTARPFATDAAALARLAGGVVQAAAMAPTGIVSNTHLLDETDVDTVCAGHDAALALARTMDIPMRMVACLEELAGELPRERLDCPILPLRRLLWMPGARRPEARADRPSWIPGRRSDR